MGYSCGHVLCCLERILGRTYAKTTSFDMYEIAFEFVVIASTNNAYQPIHNVLRYYLVDKGTTDTKNQKELKKTLLN